MTLFGISNSIRLMLTKINLELVDIFSGQTKATLDKLFYMSFRFRNYIVGQILCKRD